LDNKIVKKSIAIIFIVLFAVVFRFGQIFLSKVGTGECIESPNKKYEADVMDYSSKRFWSKECRWFEFELRSKDGKILRYLKTDPIEGPYFGSRSSHKIVFWKEDSSEVVFKFPDVEIKFKTSQ
jgi:hypothetical protein